MRRFGLAGVMALLPAFAIASTNACSGAIAVDGSPSTDAAADGKDVLQSFPKKDTGPDVAQDDDQGICLHECCDVQEINAKSIAWNPPSVAAGSCSNEDLDAFLAFVAANDDPQKWQSGAWTTNDACRSCVFGPRSSSTWAPMLLAASGALAQAGGAGCIAVVSGNEACARAVHQYRECADDTCWTCDGWFASFAECISKRADPFVCKTARTDMISACGGAALLASYEAACKGTKYRFEGDIRAQCIGLSDAGDGGGD